MSSMPMNTFTSESALLARQEGIEAFAASAPTQITTLKPTGVYEPSQPIAEASMVSYSYTDIPTTTTTPQSQEKITYARDHFGSRSMLVAFGAVGVVMLVITVWAIIAHRKGRRPFACFGGCCGRNQDTEAARLDPIDSDIPLVGAGRHYDRRPVSVQPRPIPMPAPQRPKPAQH